MSEIRDMTTVPEPDLRPLIHEIRGVQVMLDRDLAALYGVPTKRLNEQVKRNIERFPEEFMFRLTVEESKELVANCDRFRMLKHSSAAMSAFTEQGVAMLSAVLKSDTAVKESIRIIKAFVAMRRAMQSMRPLLARIEESERRQIVDQARNEERFELIFDAMQDKKFPPQKVFFDGEFFDAFEQMKRFVRLAKRELIVIDPYFDESVLELLARKRTDVRVTVVQSPRGQRNLPAIDVEKFNLQYANSLTVKVTDKFHDRFLIVDRTTLIHIGASLNYLGKKCFGFSTMDAEMIPDILARIP